MILHTGRAHALKDLVGQDVLSQLIVLTLNVGTVGGVSGVGWHHEGTQAVTVVEEILHKTRKDKTLEPQDST